MGAFDHNIQLQADITCACGHQLHRHDAFPEPADTLSLARLAELAGQYAQSVRCLCGAWRGRAGVARASYRPAGQQQCIVAAAHLNDRELTATFSLRDTHPGESLRPLLAALPASELDTAQCLGEPASVRAAWAEAIFALQLGSAHIMFPAGDGMVCIATTRPDAHGDLDLTALRTATADPADWLAVNEHADAGYALLIEADSAALLNQLASQARLMPLTAAVTHDNGLALRAPHGRFTVTVHPGQLAADAAAHGHPVAVHARHIVSLAALRVAALDIAADELAVAVHARRAVATDDQTHLRIELKDGGTVTADMNAYLAASNAERHRMLNHWRPA